MEYHIYGIINQKNGKIYIGQTKQGYRKRFIQHLTPSESCPLVRNAVKKYGREAFECELLDVVYSKEAANAAEKMWIKALGTYKPERGYNLLMGGVFGEFNDDVRRKMSIDRTGAKNNFYGKHHTEETKQRWREERKGKYALSKHPRAKSIKCVETGVVYSCVKEAQLAIAVMSLV